MESIDLLLVEDERTLAMILKDTLEGQGFRVRVAYDGMEGLRLFAEKRPNVVVADVMMPRMDGFEMLRRLRAMDAEIPFLFLTARSSVNDVVDGFELGANDYLKKPFGMQELIVRIKALLGRAHRKAEEPEKEVSVYAIGDYHFDAVRQVLTYAGLEVELSHRESEILRRLCRHSNDVVESRALLLELWRDDSFFNGRSLHVFITKLRHKLSRDERIRIINVRGIGYKLLLP